MRCGQWHESQFIYWINHIRNFACLVNIAYACRYFDMDSSTTVTFFANAHCLTPGSSQPLHPRHEEYWSVMSVMLNFCSPQVNLIYKDTFFSFTDKIDLGEQDLKVMLQNHREKRKRQPVRKGTWKYPCLYLHSVSFWINFLRTIQTWWHQTSILETYSQGQTLVGRGLYVSGGIFKTLLKFLWKAFWCF